MTSKLLLGDVLRGDEPADEFAHLPRVVDVREVAFQDRHRVAGKLLMMSREIDSSDVETTYGYGERTIESAKSLQSNNQMRLFVEDHVIQYAAAEGEGEL